MTDRFACPSARCEPGAVLLGIVTADGRVAFASDRLVIDEEFVRIAREGDSPEARFRFASPCAKGACRQWTGTRCGIIDAVLEHVGPIEPTAALPACSIRDVCRWHHQSGDLACAACPLVVTDARAPAGPEPGQIG